MLTYDSALSWYFLNLFGLNGVFKLILGSENGQSPHITGQTGADWHPP